MQKIQILWADDEIELLKPHVIFLEDKGYDVTTVKSGQDALEELDRKIFDIVFLDENMPGLTGLETLSKLKVKHESIPVVMVTKSEEESIMEDAIGSKIADYLIKPVNPNQILLSIKKNLDNKRLITEKATSGYQQEFRQIGMQLADNQDFNDWTELYKKLVKWELELENSEDSGMNDILNSQKREANDLFCRYIEKNYLSWLNGTSKETPLLSHTLFKQRILPELKDDQPVFIILIDNFRYDQWKVVQPLFTDYFRVSDEELYSSILPTATQYARNALFAGLMPSQIQKLYPNYWVNEEDEESKNQFEEQLLGEQLKRLGKGSLKFAYTKITNVQAGKKLPDFISNSKSNKLNVIVYNFVDMLSHARTEMEVIKELADNEKSYRSITASWFENSPLFEAIKLIAEMKGKVILTTDHGTICVREPSKLVGDRNVNTNLRYKQGKNLDYQKKDVFEVKNPSDAFLPKPNVSTTYVFAREDKYFVYPNNYGHFVNHFRQTFQHGGISMEEMLIPFVMLSPK